MSQVKVHKQGDCDKRIIGTLLIYEHQGLTMPDVTALARILGYSLPSIYDNIRVLANRGQVTIPLVGNRTAILTEEGRSEAIVAHLDKYVELIYGKGNLLTKS